MLLAHGAATAGSSTSRAPPWPGPTRPTRDFPVGVALRDEAGALHAGANVENASYPQGPCAESSAIGALVAAGGRPDPEAVVMADTRAHRPCGGCRQRLREFGGPRRRSISPAPRAIRSTLTLGDLLPHAFDLEEAQ